MTPVIELNLEGLVGPSHHYGGLSKGNIASTRHALTPSNPQAAALQGLEKIRFLHRLGVKQAIIPPHFRPNVTLLNTLGFYGSPEQQIKKVTQTAPELLSLIFSASSMWTANMATVTPSMDSKDACVHFSAANLISNAHRQQEAWFNFKLLQYLFNDPTHFKHHPPLPGNVAFLDEGAANHNRLCQHHGSSGLHLFIYGKQGLAYGTQESTPKHFPARQTKSASEAIARRHGLSEKNTFFIQQAPIAIDSGVFHHDVIGVVNECVMLIHENAWVNQTQWIKRIQEHMKGTLHLIEFSAKDLSLEDAIHTYLFNSQLITLQDHPKQMILLAPKECELHPIVYPLLMERLKQDPYIHDIFFIPLKESMQNGGGPACLRLRVPLTQTEYLNVHPESLVTDERINTLEHWVKKYYRTHLTLKELSDPAFLREIEEALDALTVHLKLDRLYAFQQ